MASARSLGPGYGWPAPRIAASVRFHYLSTKRAYLHCISPTLACLGQRCTAWKLDGGNPLVVKVSRCWRNAIYHFLSHWIARFLEVPTWLAYRVRLTTTR